MEKYPRSRQARWDKRRLRTISTHVSLEQWADLRRLCNEAGTTVYRVLQDAVVAAVESANAAPDQQRKPDIAADVRRYLLHLLVD